MASRSSHLRRLEGEFIEKFLVRVARADGSLDLGDFDARFQRAWRELSRGPLDVEDLIDLVQRLRPDPISGVSPTLHQCVHRLQPGRLAMPNPGYSDGAVLLSPTDDDHLAALGQDFPARFEAAVAAYRA